MYSRSIGYSRPGTCKKISRLRVKIIKLKFFLPSHLDDRGIVKVPGEQLYVDGSWHEYQFEVGPAVNEAVEYSEEKVAVDMSLVHLVDDEDLVPGEEGVCLQLSQEEACKGEEGVIGVTS